MNRILFDRLAPQYTLEARDPRFEHVRGVLRMGEGDSFDVGLVNGPVGKARIRSLEAGRMSVEVEWGERPPLPPPVHLLVGLGRPATMRKILVTAPTLGVRGLQFALSGRSDPAYARSRLWGPDGDWSARLIEGVEQAFDTYVPPVRMETSLEAALAGLPVGGRRLALDVYEGTEPLSRAEVPAEGPVCLAVGPERGWDARDRDSLRGHGFTLVSLGQRVLRVETAVTVGLALLLARMGSL